MELSFCISVGILCMFMLISVHVHDMASIPDPAANNRRNWVIGNCKQYGYYRVNYDERNWIALIEQLKEDHTVCMSK